MMMIPVKEYLPEICIPLLMYTMLSQSEKELLKAEIIDNIESVQLEIEDLEELTKPVAPDNAIGRLSRMEALNSKSVNDTALISAKNRLSKLEYALATIDGPDFGKCAECKIDIPYKRLMFMPESDRCVQCAR